MNRLVSTYRIVKKHFKQVAFQNAVTLVNIIFLAVSLLLLVFKEVHESFFLAGVLLLNIVIGIIQDLRAKIALEQLQILMTPQIVRMAPSGKEETIAPEAVRVGDDLKIAFGDQIPADGVLLESSGLEVNEALLTGESSNIPKAPQDQVLAGSIVTAGSGVLRVGVLPNSSFVALMTEKIKQYTLNLSPIQHTLNTFIKYMTYLLLAIVVYVIVHGLTVDELMVSMIKDIAALAGTLVPQGLILATTVFFAYGAVRLFKKQVLLQEINATEKLGRIKNLCVDKTGTLTENKPVWEGTVLYKDYPVSAAHLLADGYIAANKDNSETTKAVHSALTERFTGTVLHALPFSSSRKYGAATLQIEDEVTTVVMGAPDILLARMAGSEERAWVEGLIETYAPQAKRLVLLGVTREVSVLPAIGQAAIYPVAMFILANPLRPGTAEIIKFFQNRGVSIRVISGDNPRTVQAIAAQAGVKLSDMIVTGPEMERWDDEAFAERVPAYHLFARISPQQKEKIIAQLKTNGFTAMVGDGANDALAIKHADLGIAMFDGAGATRQIAQVVLMNNSFSALPEGVSLAETIITNLELVVGVFFNSISIGLLLFVILAILGYTYPLSPRNTTIINYCIIWLPMVYWAIFPAHKKGASPQMSFLKKVLPFSLLNGLLTAAAAAMVFALGPAYFKIHGSNIYVILTIITLGYRFFMLAPAAYGASVNESRKKVTLYLAGAVAVFLIVATLTPSLSVFFDLRRPSWLPLLQTLGIIFLFGYLQHLIAKKWFSKKSDEP